VAWAKPTTYLPLSSDIVSLVTDFVDHSLDLYAEFHWFSVKWAHIPGHNMLHLLQASPAPPHLKRGSHEKPPSPSSLPLKPSYSQIVKTKILPHDPGKVTCDPSCDPLPVSTPCDQSHDQT